MQVFHDSILPSGVIGFFQIEKHGNKQTVYLHSMEGVRRAACDQYNGYTYTAFLAVFVYATLGLTDTQRIESLHEKVKKVVKKNSEIVSFCHSILTILDDHASATHHKAMDSVNRTSVKLLAVGDSMLKYAEALTPYAYGMVMKQSEASLNVTVQEE